MLEAHLGKMELAYFGMHSYYENEYFIRRKKLLLLDILWKFSFFYLYFLSHKLCLNLMDDIFFIFYHVFFYVHKYFKTQDKSFILITDMSLISLFFLVFNIFLKIKERLEEVFIFVIFTVNSKSADYTHIWNLLYSGCNMR